MKEQKFLIVESAYDVNDWLDKGWEVVSVTPQHVAVALTGNVYSHKTVTGKFAVVIQKQKAS